MSKKILIIGGVAGGASTAARARRIDEHAEIIIFEKGPHVSFSNCSLPYHLSDVVEKIDDLVLMEPGHFEDEYNIEARVNNEVLEIDRENKELVVKNLLTGEEYREGYDKLVLSPGASPIMLPCEGLDTVNLFTVRNVPDIGMLKNHIKEKSVKTISVIGGGFIGVEVAENLKKSGYKVTLIEAMDQIMKPFDYDMAQILHKEIHDNGINLLLGDPVDRFKKDTVILGSGREVQSDVVVMAIGVKAETRLAVESGLELGKTGAIKVDHNYLTNDKDIYAVGDAIEVWHKLLHRVSILALAGPAQKQARAVANHIFGGCVQRTGVIGSSVIQIFNMNAAATGLNESLIEVSGLDIEYDTVTVIPSDKVSLMPGSEPMHFKLIFEKPTGKILGAQAIGRGNVDKRIDVIATAIHFNATLRDLAQLELTYAPPFGTAKDIVNHAALVGLNILERKYDQVKVTEVRELVERDAFIIDVRDEEEWDEGHLINAVHIPMGEVRERLDEIPKDEPIYLHCRSGQRSYNVVTALQHLGYNNVKNISGSFLGISYYEYFNDVSKERKPIVTEYNFE